MTPQGIYKNVLLPEILDFCQSFFPSLIELSCNNCLPDIVSTEQNINNTSVTLKIELKKSLTIDALKTQLNKAQQLQELKINERTSELISQMNRNLACVTELAITQNSNPLAPALLFNLITRALNASYGNTPSVLLRDIQQQFLLLARGFYKKINSFFIPYLKHYNTPTATIKKPVTALDNPTSHLNPTSNISNSNTNTNTQLSHCSTLSIDQAQTAIEQTKAFFEDELAAKIIGGNLQTLCKKLYIPAINYSLSRPNAFNTSSNSAFKQLLLHIKVIGRYCSVDTTTQKNLALVATTEIIVNRFIKNVMEGEIDLACAIGELAPLANECQAQIDKVKISAKRATETARPSRKNTQILSNTAVNQNYHNTTSAKYPSAKQQAKHLLDTIMIDNDVTNSVAAKLKQDWLKVLEIIGSIHGINSTPWNQAIESFINLLNCSTPTKLPPALANKVQAQLKFAGLNVSLFSNPTSKKHIVKKTEAPTPHANSVQAASLREGMWFDYNDGGVIIRCKLAAIIKQIGRYIFVSRQGQKVLAVNLEELQSKLMNNELYACNNALLNNTLEDILTNIKNTHTLTPN